MTFTTDSDMEYVLLQSRISGGHYLNDLRKRVPYDSTLRLTKDEVQSSDDLSRAIRKNLVEVKKRLHSKTRQPESRGDRVESQVESQVENQVGGSESQAESRVESTAEVVERDENDEEIEELKTLNRRLMMTIQNLIQQQESLSSKQEDLMGKMEDFLDQPSPQTIQAVDLSSSGENNNRGRNSEVSEIDGDYDTFVPNQIRSGEAETSGQLEMEEEEEKSGDRLDKAAEMMDKLQSEDDED